MTEFAVSVQDIPALPVVALRHVGPYDTVGPTFEKVAALTAIQGLWTPTTQGVMLSYDDPRKVPAAELRSDCCLVVKEEATAQAPLQRLDVASGPYGVVRHHGPCQELPQLFDRFWVWLQDSDYEFLKGTPVVELYITNPRTTPPTEQVVEIRIPLKPRS